MNTRVRLEDLDPNVAIGQLEYSFEELGIEIADGFCAGLFSGSADIEYFPDGQFSVEDIYLDTFRRMPAEDRFIKLDIREHESLWCALEKSIQKAARDEVDQALWRL